jgi:hypothetical protein
MMKTPPPTLEQLAVRLEEQALDIANLRTAINIQFVRIAHMQAGLDQLPTVNGRPNVRPRAHNWNRRHDN